MLIKIAIPLVHVEYEKSRCTRLAAAVIEASAALPGIEELCEACNSIISHRQMKRVKLDRISQFATAAYCNRISRERRSKVRYRVVLK